MMSVRLFRRIGQGLLREATRRLGEKGKKDDVKTLSSLFMPAPIQPNSDYSDTNVGEELASKIKKADLLTVLNRFQKRPEVAQLYEDNGLDARLFQQAFTSFRNFCLQSTSLDPSFHIVCSDLLQGSGHITDIFPYFMQHAKQVFPHLDCMEELQKISDLRLPANWYPEARSIERKFVFHAGPTNSGKTYRAMEAFIKAESGVYCGPLKMLAVEVFQKTNSKGTPCDLVTGEDRQYASDSGPSKHLACTVEMASTVDIVDVAIIDEIQMVRDPQRGWAWTRALLGLPAKEVHLCGEEAALYLVRDILAALGEEVVVHKYKRLTPLTILDKPLGSLEKLEPGDCVVCFNKNDIYHVSLAIEAMGQECAIIYGALPPGAKAMQADKFNDPNDKCKILVATDAIGMGLNLSIRRIIFYSLIKPTLNDEGQREPELISVSQALQIAGRAGRYGTTWEGGFATTMRGEDLPILKDLLRQKPGLIERAGLHPTADQIELFTYHLPHATLSNLIDIFVSLSQMDSSQYFMCNIDTFKYLADMIQHVPLPLRARYVFCCAPINLRMPFVCTMFLNYARQYSRNEPMTERWLQRKISWPLRVPSNIAQLVHLEAVFDVMDLYLWFSYRFPDLFPEQEPVRAMQKELDQLIQEGVLSLTRLLRATRSETATPATPKPVGENETSDEVSNVKLTDQLLAQGLITEEQLKTLHKEWKQRFPSTTGKKRKSPT
ncbi:ATP-dependent RNA helicase SUV3 -like protein [Tropilaelaps mercedesae]|uniref:ATP-dependent RNA helicase SUV3 homolog, mitochondrial n=1 Tax=Tropilaelaps mercedesae TaxID=418985 RepID=A0A1V9XMG4_9ACAR|nr:ATP-dependent RNA helicase SUV3 -like protein [Tropilaelaps mercedesae]